MSMYTYFQKEAKDLHLPPGSCLKEREIEKAIKLVKIAAEIAVAHDQQQYLASAQ